MATILNEQNYISQASDIATKYGYALAYDEENEIVSIQYAEDFQQTDDFSYYSKMVYEILNVGRYQRLLIRILSFQREKLIIIVALAWGHCCVILPIILPNKFED